MVVIARIMESGPIGQGRCHSRSYQIAIERTVTPDSPTFGDALWVHHEQCDSVTVPADGVHPETLDDGKRYQLTLRRGASENFADGFMIVGSVAR